MSFIGYHGGMGLRSKNLSVTSGGLYQLKSSGVSSAKKGTTTGSISWSSIRDAVADIIQTDKTDTSGVSGKADKALTSEYKSALEAQAKQDAAAGAYGKDGRAGELRDAQMKQYVSPDRDGAIAQVNKLLAGSAIGSVGSIPVKLSGLPYTASVTRSASGLTAEIYDENGEKFAAYDSKTGKWTSVETRAEAQFKAASSAIYDEAYRAAQSGGAGGSGAGSGLDTRA